MSITLDAVPSILAAHGEPSHCQIIAGAGAGKTQEVAKRIVALLADGVPPSQIVGLCYNVQAAAELKERVQSLAVEAEIPAIGMAEMFVGTLHSYCLDLLTTHVFEFAGYRVLTDVQARLLVRNYPKQSGMRAVEIASGPS